MCRKQYVDEMRMPIDTVEGLQQLLRDATYYLMTGPIWLSPDEREQRARIMAFTESSSEEIEEKSGKRRSAFLARESRDLKQPILEIVRRFRS